MEEEKKLNKGIYQLEQESWEQQERIKLTLQGDIYDQSMNKRRADSDGQSELKKAEHRRTKAERHTAHRQITTSRT